MEDIDAKLVNAVHAMVEGERRLVTYRTVCAEAGVDSTTAKRALRRLLNENKRFAGLWTFVLRRGGVLRIVVVNDSQGKRWENAGWKICSCCVYAVGSRKVVEHVGDGAVVGVEDRRRDWEMVEEGGEVANMLRQNTEGRIKAKGAGRVKGGSRKDQGKAQESRGCGARGGDKNVEKKKGFGFRLLPDERPRESKRVGLVAKFTSNNKRGRVVSGDQGSDSGPKENDMKERKRLRDGLHSGRNAAPKKASTPSKSSKSKGRGGLSMRTMKRDVTRSQQTSPAGRATGPSRRGALVSDSEDEDDEQDGEVKAMEREEQEREEREKETKKWNPLEDDEEPEAEMTDTGGGDSDIEMQDVEKDDRECSISHSRNSVSSGDNDNADKGRRASKRRVEDVEAGLGIENGQQRIDRQPAPKSKRIRKVVEETGVDDDGFIVTSRVLKIFDSEGNEIADEPTEGTKRAEGNSSSSRDGDHKGGDGNTSGPEKHHRRKTGGNEMLIDSPVTPEGPKRNNLVQGSQSSQRSSASAKSGQKKKKYRSISSYFGKKG